MAESPSHLYPETDTALISFLNERWRKGVEFRSGADIRAFWNIAFSHGHQWLYEASGRSETRLSRIPVDADDPNAPVMLTINKVAGYVDRAIAELTENTPGVEVRPVADEDSDWNAAQVGSRISASEDERMELATLLPRLYTWVVPAGWAFLQVTWNAEDGRKVGDDPDLAKMDVVRELFEGNADADIAPHSEVVMDPMATDAWDARWAIRQAALTSDEVYERWGKMVDKPIGLAVISDQLQQLATSAARISTGADRIAVRQFWLRPGCSRQYPEGFTFTWAGNTVLEARKAWPYEKMRRIPLIQFNYLPPQGGWWGRTPVSDLIDPQIDYNRARSLEADISSRLIPKVFYPDGSITPDEVSARVEWVPYMAGNQPPTPMVFDPGWFQQHELIMNRTRAEMDERMSQTDASKGMAAGTSPAAGVMAQQQAASKPYQVPAKEMARGLKHFGWVRLMLVRQYWREDRLVRTWSRAGTLAVDRFKSADLADELDVVVRAESILPRSKAAQAQMAMQLLSSKTPGFTMRHFFRMVDLPGTDLITEVYDADERHAERENNYMATKGKKAPSPPADASDGQAMDAFVAKLGEMGLPSVSPRDNHEIHIETHRLHMISPEYERYSPKVKAIFEAHIATHESILATRMQAQMQQMSPPPAVNGQANGNGNGVPSIEALAGMRGGPGGGMSEPGVPPGIDADEAAALIGR